MIKNTPTQIERKITQKTKSTKVFEHKYNPLKTGYDTNFTLHAIAHSKFFIVTGRPNKKFRKIMKMDRSYNCKRSAFINFKNYKLCKITPMLIG